MRFQLFVAWNIYTTVFLPIFVFCWSFCCFWSLQSVFLCSFLCNLRVVLLMYRRYYYVTSCKFFTSSLADGISLWVTVSLHRSPGLYSVFRPITLIMQSRWPRFSLWFQTLSSPLTKSLEIVLSALTTIGTTVTFIFHSCF